MPAPASRSLRSWCSHAPEKRGAHKHRGSHYPEHKAIDYQVNVAVVQVDRERAVAHAPDNVAQVARQRLNQAFPISIGVLEPAKNSADRESPTDHCSVKRGNTSARLKSGLNR